MSSISYRYASTPQSLHWDCGLIWICMCIWPIYLGHCRSCLYTPLAAELNDRSFSLVEHSNNGQVPWKECRARASIPRGSISFWNGEMHIERLLDKISKKGEARNDSDWCAYISVTWKRPKPASSPITSLIEKSIVPRKNDSRFTDGDELLCNIGPDMSLVSKDKRFF